MNESGRFIVTPSAGDEGHGRRWAAHRTNKAFMVLWASDNAATKV
jgi:hypothetical protein